MTRRLAAVIGATIVATGGCGATSSGSDTTVRVAAAASLTDVMELLTEEFEDTTDVEVELNLGASSALALQIEEGAPVDVFASADVVLIDELRGRAGGVGDPVVFATNDLVIAVPIDADDRVDDLDDFADDDLLLGACAAQVPCGGYAASVFELAGIDPALDTEETDVRSLAAKVAAGDLDAGLVYRTDVTAAADELRAVELPSDAAVEATYGVATVDRSGDDTAGSDGPGARFVDFLLSADGQAILRAQGFGAP